MMLGSCQATGQTKEVYFLVNTTALVTFSSDLLLCFKAFELNSLTQVTFVLSILN